MTKTAARSAPRLTAAAPLAIAAAMLAIYIVWGTTYLAIRVVVDPDQGVAIPPFAMVAIRFAFAGLAMLALVGIFARDALRSLTRAQIRDQAIVGIALNVGGLGVTSFGEQTIPSGIAALVIALLPIWVAVIGRVVYGDAIAPLSIVGIVVGIIGVVILIAPNPGEQGLDPLGLACVLISPLSWGGGSIWSQRRAATPAHPLVAVTLQMLAGAIGGAVVAALLGEWGSVRFDALGADVLVALAYLIVIGSLVAYNIYTWLLRVAPFGLVSTYAYVNPVVAVLAGSIILNEPISGQLVVGATVVVAGVAIMVTARNRAVARGVASH
ncbi:MAG: EamA family transporter [Candidatus Limnocylindrus sp.]|jgi:drug/metabolite transporter (DMT)-like permease